MVYFQAMQRSIDKAVELIDSITDNMQFDNVREILFDAIVAVIHLAGDIYPRIKDCSAWSKCDEEKEFFLAFIYLNNQIKHDLALEMFYYEVYCSSFPAQFPFRLGQPGVVWADFPDHGKSREAKREYYDRFLKHKDVKESLKRLNDLLKNV